MKTPLKRVAQSVPLVMSDTTGGNSENQEPGSGKNIFQNIQLKEASSKMFGRGGQKTK